MGYTSPDYDSNNANYSAQFQHSNGDEYEVKWIGFGGDPDPMPDETARDAAFLEIMDHLNAHTDLTCTNGAKRFEGSQSITPTP